MIYAFTCGGRRCAMSRAEKRLYRAFRRMVGMRRITPARSRRLIRPTYFPARIDPIEALRHE